MNYSDLKEGRNHLNKFLPDHYEELKDLEPIDHRRCFAKRRLSRNSKIWRSVALVRNPKLQDRWDIAAWVTNASGALTVKFCYKRLVYGKLVFKTEQEADKALKLLLEGDLI